MNTRTATLADAPLLAVLNEQLIRDEGHRNRRTMEQLTERMHEWLATDYIGIIFEQDGAIACYALYRREPEHVYLRQFFVVPEFRRKGVGRSAMQWLLDNDWKDALRIRLDVLIQNRTGQDFWRAIGFKDYCITMDLNRPVPPASA